MAEEAAVMLAIPLRRAIRRRRPSATKALVFQVTCNILGEHGVRLFPTVIAQIWGHVTRSAVVIPFSLAQSIPPGSL
jgi:hypothetical protein